jgi:hypothetical protein
MKEILCRLNFKFSAEDGKTSLLLQKPTCLFDDNTKCTNSEYCRERRVLQMEYMNRKERDSNDYMYENESVSDLVTIKEF